MFYDIVEKKSMFTMNFDFTYYTPTKIYFGRNALTNLRTELPKYGPTVLMVYGRNSIKKNGLYDTIMEYMKEAGKTVWFPTRMRLSA